MSKVSAFLEDTLNEETFVFPNAYEMFDKSVQTQATTEQQLRAIYELINPITKHIKLTNVSSATVERLLELNYEITDFEITDDHNVVHKCYEMRWRTPEPISSIKKRKFSGT